MFKGLQWKIVLLYSLLILFALQFIGVFLVQSLERYYFSNYVEGVETQAKLLSSFLTPRILEEEGSHIEDIVDGFKATKDIDIMVLDRYARVAGISGSDEMVGSRFVREEVTKALSGNPGEAVRINRADGNRFFYLAYPVKYEGNVMGVIYLSSSLESIDRTLNEIKRFIITGSLFVLAVSFLVGLFLTRTITSPIREVTEKAALMAQGDFSQRVQAYSEDEIGQLGNMYNYLAARLNSTLGEISSEKSKVEAIINNMSDGILALDGSGCLIHINPAAIRLLKGFDSSELIIGKTPLFLLNDIIGSDRLEKFYQQKLSIFFDVAGENSSIVIRLTLAAFQLDEGKTDGMLVVINDITGEEEIKRRQQDFVANVSHELKTPLTSIKSYVETLLEENLENTDIALKFLKVVNNETNRMVTLTNDLLTLSRLDARQGEFSLFRVDVSELLREIISRGELKRVRKPEIMLEIAESIPPVYVNRSQIKQLFINLLNNALQYTPEEGNIEVTAEEQGDMVQFCVRDNGMGIPENEKERVFERFYRVDKTRSRDYGGTGLGLSIAKEAVETHGGRIWIESLIEEGTAVFFTLPRNYEKEPVEE